MCKPQQPQDQNQKELQDQKFKLWSYCENKFSTICQNFDNNVPDVIPMVEVLCLIVNKFTCENYQRRLLADVFFEMEEMYFLNVDLHIMLLK